MLSNIARFRSYFTIEINQQAETDEKITEANSETFVKDRENKYLYSRDHIKGAQDTNDLLDGLYFDTNRSDNIIKENDDVIENNEL